LRVSIPSSTADRPFQVASLGCAAAAVASVVWLFTDAAQRHGEFTRVAVFAAGVALLLAAAWLYVWPARARLLAAPLLDLPTALQETRGQLTDLLAIRKEYNKVRTDMEGFANQTTQVLKAVEDALKEGLAALDARQQLFDQAVLDLQKAEREKMDLRQARGDADRRTEAWRKATLQFARLLERTADAESGLDEGYRKAAAKLADDFDKAFAPLGLHLLRPNWADLFDDRVHEYDGEVERADVPAGRVVECAEWGYVIGDIVHTKAKVRLARAPQPLPEPETYPADIATISIPEPAVEALGSCPIDPPPRQTTTTVANNE